MVEALGIIKGRVLTVTDNTPEQIPSDTEYKSGKLSWKPNVAEWEQEDLVKDNRPFYRTRDCMK